MNDERPLAQFFFEVGYGSCFAEAMVKNDCKSPFVLTDAMIEWAWEIAPECHDDGDKFGQRKALADTAPELLAALVGLEQSGLLGRLESNASGMPEWEAVSKRIDAARAAILKATGGPA